MLGGYEFAIRGVFFAFASRSWWCVPWAVAVIGAGLSDVAFSIVVGEFVRLIQLGSELSAFMPVLIGYIAVVAIYALSQGTLYSLNAQLVAVVMRQMRGKSLAGLMSGRGSHGETCESMQTHLSMLEESMRLMYEKYNLVLRLISVVVVVMTLSPVTGTVLIVTIAAVVLGVRPLRTQAAERVEEYQASQSALAAVLADTWKGLGAIRILLAEGWAYARIESPLKAEARAAETSRVAVAKVFSVPFGLTWGVATLALMVGSILVMLGELSAPAFTTIAMSVRVMVPIVFDLAFIYGRSVAANPSLRAYDAVAKAALSPTLSSSTKNDETTTFGNIARIVPVSPAVLDDDAFTPSVKADIIEFDRVSGWYDGSEDRKVLQDLSFRVKPGGQVALVGKSGCGKSSVFAALLGKLELADATTVRVQGRAISALPEEERRSLFGVVPQHPVLFSTSLRENITLGSIDLTDEDVISACKLAGAWRFIKELPNGLDTRVGSAAAAQILGDGSSAVQLSGGQIQRIAIARAVVRKPKLLLLDEWTSALDRGTAVALTRQVVSACRSKGIATLQISHSLGLLDNTDEILYLSHGKIIEQGSFNELLHQRGAFRRLYSRRDGGWGAVKFAIRSSLRAVKSFRVVAPSSRSDSENTSASTDAFTGDAKILDGLSNTVDDDGDEEEEKKDDDREAVEDEDENEEEDETDETSQAPLPKLSANTSMSAESVEYELLGDKENDATVEELNDQNLELHRAEASVSPWKLLKVLPELLTQDVPWYYTAFVVIVNLIRGVGDTLLSIIIAIAMSATSIDPVVIVAFVALTVAFTLSASALDPLHGVMLARATSRLLRRQVKGLLFMDPDEARALAATQTRDLAVLRESLWEVLVLWNQVAFFPLAVLVYMIVTTPLMAPLFLFWVLVASALALYMSQWAVPFHKDREAADVAAADVFSETVRGHTVLAQAGAEEWAAKRFEEIASAVKRAQVRYDVAAAMGQDVPYTISFLFYAGVVAALAVMVLQGTISLEVFFAITMILRLSVDAPFYLSQMAERTTRASQPYARLSFAATVGTTALQHRKRLEQKYSDAPSSEKGGPSIIFDGFCARYSADSRPVIPNLNLRIERGEQVALTGPSGSGKSSVLRAILGTLAPCAPATHTSVIVDGQFVSHTPPSHLFRRVGIVEQFQQLFSGSIRDNVSLGTPEATDDDIWDALRASGLGGFVHSLPNGLDTQLGSAATVRALSHSVSVNVPEDGADASAAQTSVVSLSGGQTQRIGIARALLRKPDILLLDEFTSALDPPTARTVTMDVIKSCRERGITTVQVSHTLDLLPLVDRIIVLDRGEFVEEGDYATLARKKGVFFSLLAGQASS